MFGLVNFIFGDLCDGSIFVHLALNRSSWQSIELGSGSQRSSHRSMHASMSRAIFLASGRDGDTDDDDDDFCDGDGWAPFDLFCHGVLAISHKVLRHSLFLPQTQFGGYVGSGALAY